MHFVGNLYRLSTSERILKNRLRFDEITVTDLGGPVFFGHDVHK